jgi:hypothetical protein
MLFIVADKKQHFSTSASQLKKAGERREKGEEKPGFPFSLLYSPSCFSDMLFSRG